MELLPGVTIRAVPPVNAEDPRGPTFEWCKGEAGGQVTIYARREGSILGNHYHTGADPSKAPEKFLLAQGRLRLHAVDGRNGLRADAEIEAGSEIRIGPHILHWMEALTDLIFVEYRATPFDPERDDTHPPETYADYVRRVRGG